MYWLVTFLIAAGMCLTRANIGELIWGVAYSMRWSGPSGREGMEAGAWGCWWHCIHSQESGDEYSAHWCLSSLGSVCAVLFTVRLDCRHSFTGTGRDVSLGIALVNGSEVSGPPTHVGHVWQYKTAEAHGGQCAVCASSKSEDEEEGQGHTSSRSQWSDFLLSGLAA